MAAKRSESEIQSVERAVAILKAFGLEGPDLGVTTLSRKLDLHKSTVSRLLATLQHTGLVEQDPSTAKYRLGLGLVELAGFVLERLDVRQVARPHLLALAQATRETVSLTVLDHGECINIEQISGPQMVKNVGWIGRRTPVHATSTGKALLAYVSKPELEEILDTKLLPFTRRTITDPSVLREELRRIRHEGYATAQEELEEGLNAVASPIKDYSGEVVAAVSVSGPAYRVGPEKFEDLAVAVKQAARNVSRELGDSGGGPISN